MCVGGPDIIYMISGKRKSGKDFISDRLKGKSYLAFVVFFCREALLKLCSVSSYFFHTICSAPCKCDFVKLIYLS